MDALAAVGDPQLREALVWARRQPGPVTADEAATALCVHRNVARSRLERLTEAGLLRVAFERRSGRTGPGAGRPAKTYAVAPELHAPEFPDGRYEPLIALLLEALPDGKQHEVGVAYGRSLATTGRTRSVGERVCGSLRELGYQASVDESDGDELVVTTPTCPLRPLLAHDARAIDLDLGMWKGLVAACAGVEPGAVTCDAQGCLDDDAPCRVRVELRTRRALRAS